MCLLCMRIIVFFYFNLNVIKLIVYVLSYLHTCRTCPALRTHARYDTRVIRSIPRNYTAELYIGLYMTWTSQLVEHLYVRETWGSTPFLSIAFCYILMLRYIHVICYDDETIKKLL